jgi:hypothetical protein
LQMFDVVEALVDPIHAHDRRGLELAAPPEYPARKMRKPRLPS